jgi:hypothetical protein
MLASRASSFHRLGAPRCLPPSPLQVNKQLKSANHSQMVVEELIAGRLYTGDHSTV